jgi:hypothetical protein
MDAHRGALPAITAPTGSTADRDFARRKGLRIVKSLLAA